MAQASVVDKHKPQNQQNRLPSSQRAYPGRGVNVALKTIMSHRTQLEKGNFYFLFFNVLKPDSNVIILGLHLHSSVIAAGFRDHSMHF